MSTLVSNLARIWNWFFIPAGFETLDSNDQKFVLRTNLLSLFIVAVAPPFAYIFFSLGATTQAVGALVVTASSYFAFSMNRAGYYQFARNYELYSTGPLLFYFVYFFGPESGLHFLYVAFLSFPLFLKPRKKRVFQLMEILYFFVLFMVGHYDLLSSPRILPLEKLLVINEAMTWLVMIWICFIVYFTHLTNEKAEALLAEALDQLQVKNKDLENYVYIVSHDLQEPVKTVISYGGLLTDKKFPPEAEQEELFKKIILDTAKRMQLLIEGLMNLSRIGGALHFEPFRVKPLLEEVKESISFRIEEVEADIQDKGLNFEITGQKVEMRQLFQNLILNALKFKDPEKKPVVTICGQVRKEEFIFSVKDNGIGIAPKDQQKIFGIFKRLHAKEQYEGLGLGLAFCKKIVELHGGEIWVKSQPGEGAEFFFTIPKKLSSLHEKA